MLQTITNKFSERDLKLDPRLALFGMAGLAALLALVVVFYLWRDNASFQPLYGAGESYPAAEVMQVLDSERVRYRLHVQSGQILVREDHLARARMLLSAKGIRVTLPTGYELFDKDEPLGTSQFVQNVRLKRSLEGELARTVMSLRGVDQARVHLAQEENNSFVVSRRAPTTASVMVQLTPGHRLEHDQVLAIVNLVANSVPRLQAEDVSVVDQYGTLLSRSLDGQGGPTQSWQVRDEYRQKAVANIEEVLAPVVGRGNYRISVAADFDFSQREETSQTYGEVPRLRNESWNAERALDRLALGVPGSLANIPVNTPLQPQGANPGADGETENLGATTVSERTNRVIDYDQTITRVRFPAFALRQQSVSVVLNAQSAPEGGWSEAMRTELAATIASAVGLSEARGDVLTLNVFPFAPVETVIEPPLWWESEQVYALARLGLGALLALALFLVAGRALRALASAKPELPPVAEEAVKQIQSEPVGGQLQAPPQEPETGREAFSELNPLAEIPLPAPDSGLELQIEHLQMLAENDPERVSEIIKHWIGRNERDRDSTV